MGGKTKKSETTTDLRAAPLGTPAFFGPQEDLFRQVGDIFGQRLKDPLSSPGFAQGRDFLSRRATSQKRDVRSAPGLFAGTRIGAARDIEAAQTQGLSSLIASILQQAPANALDFARNPIPRGNVFAAAQRTSAPGQTFGENLAGFGNIFGANLAAGLGQAPGAILAASQGAQNPAGSASDPFG